MSGGAGVVAPAIEGFLLSAGLIIAIGAQNAFVLRQGLVGRHVGLVVAVCGLSDAALIALGVAGAGALIADNPAVIRWVTAGGAAFLVAYGLLAARRAWRGGGTLEAAEAANGAAAVLTTTLALTFLNPHVYLDTVVLIGAISVRYEGGSVVAFTLGAMAASAAWFAALGYGARLLAPLFRQRAAWRVLDGVVAITMLAIAARLVASAFLV